MATSTAAGSRGTSGKAGEEALIRPPSHTPVVFVRSVIDQLEASSTSGSFCPAASSPGPSFGAVSCRGHVMSPSPFLSGSLPYKNRHISFITALNTEASSSVVVTVSLCHQISNPWRLSRGLSPSVSCQSLRFCELLAARCFWFWFW